MQPLRQRRPVELMDQWEMEEDEDRVEMGNGKNWKGQRFVMMQGYLQEVLPECLDGVGLNP